MALQERECLSVELGDILVNRGMRAVFEDYKLAFSDAVLHRVCKSRGSHQIMTTKSD